jgi:prepilin-type N-terminal cleavage/methylation domain-containing protein
MKQRPARGFTVIELMTVMVIAAILLVIAAPSFNDMLAKRRLEGQANELVTDLSYAKSEAVQRNRSVFLRTHPTSNTCYIIGALPDPAGTADCSCDATPRCSGGATELKTVLLGNGVTVTSNRRITFEPVRGTANAESITVALDARNHTVSVAANGRIAPFTP